MGHLQCVIFSPEDLMMIKEGPGIRRKYIDMMISQVHPVYFMELQKYQKNLDQRNAIIRESKKNGYVPQDLMDTFDEQLAKSAAVIIPLRRLMIEKTNQIAAQTYNEISGREMENFQLRYMCCLKNDDRIEEQFLSTLKKNRDEDVFRGTTSFGIHREDIQTLLNEKEMKLFASQGQIRTAALSMKLAHIDLFHELTGEDPVLLLDDVMSELDMGRRKRLLNKISRVQTFITCTDESDLQLSERPQSYFVSLNSENLGHVEERYSVVNNQSSESIEITDPDFS
jgi:DNA replication and repair protein RecF